MIKIMPVLIISLILAGCSSTSEKYRYKLRFDRFYFLLNGEEKGYFASNDLDKLAGSVASRLSNDAKLMEKWRDMQFNEAIATFDPYQTSHFFREIILKELNRDNYYLFMKELDSKAQLEFALNTNFMSYYIRYYKTDGLFKSLVDSLKTDYRLYNFSDEELYYFLRHTIFPESTQKEMVFYLLKLLNGCGALSDFKAGNYTSAALKLKNDIQNNPVNALEFEKIRKASGLTMLTLEDLVRIYGSVVMKEMDPYALSHTLSKF